MMKIGTDLIPMNKLAVLAVFFLITGFRHPMHVTVTEVEFDKESKAIEMSMHVFTDDLETHLRFIENNESLDIIELNTEARDQLLKTYFVKEVKLKVNGKNYLTSYLGHQVEGDALWVFMEVPSIKKLKTLEIKNTTLLDLYDDQANLIHFEYEGEIYSEKLDKETLVARYDIENL